MNLAPANEEVNSEPSLAAANHDGSTLPAPSSPTPKQKETLLTLMADGKIEAGRKLVFTYHEEDFFSVLQPNGTLLYKGKEFGSLSGFGSHCMKIWQDRRGGLDEHTNKKKTVDGWFGVRYVNENNERIMMDKLRRNPKSTARGIARSAKKEKKPSRFYIIRKLGEYLQGVENHDPRTLEELAAALDVELQFIKMAVKDMLVKGRTLGFNLKILSGRDATITAEVSEVEDEVEGGKVKLQYTSKYKNIRNKYDILNLINNSGNNRKEEILVNDLSASYAKCRQDIASLIRDGQIIGLYADQQKSTVVSRPLKYFCKLPGKVFVHRGSRFIETTMDLRGDLRRGDCIRICSSKDFESDTYNDAYQSSIYRVSRASKNAGQSVSLLSLRLSVSCPSEYKKAIVELPTYQFPFNASVLSLDVPYMGKPYDKTEEGFIYKFGVSNEIRRAWSDMTSANWPVDQQAMIERLRETGIASDIYGEEIGNGSSASKNNKKKAKSRKRTRKRKKY